jgi:hypothetical protein
MPRTTISPGSPGDAVPFVEEKILSPATGGRSKPALGYLSLRQRHGRCFDSLDIGR